MKNQKRRLSAEAEWSILNGLLVASVLLGATAIVLDAFGH